MQRETSEKEEAHRLSGHSVRKKKRKTDNSAFQILHVEGRQTCRTSWWLDLWGLY